MLADEPVVECCVICGRISFCDLTQLDCIDTSVNTWTYMTLMERSGLFAFHRVAPLSYAPLRNTAVLQEINGGYFAIDASLVDVGVLHKPEASWNSLVVVLFYSAASGAPTWRSTGINPKRPPHICSPRRNRYEFERMLYAPGISWQVLRIVVAFGSLGFFLVILLFT